LLPGGQDDILELLTPQRLASIEYQKACQVHGTFLWQDVTEPDTFRMTKPILKFVYSITVQFRVSALSQDTLEKLSRLVGAPLHHGLLLERTKRRHRPDRTIKAKSILLYSKVQGGILVQHLTIVVQSSLPLIIQQVIHRFGGWGIAETFETCQRTRQYLRGLLNE
jgi:hypothetical protein